MKNERIIGLKNTLQQPKIPAPLKPNKDFSQVAEFVDALHSATDEPRVRTTIVLPKNIYIALKKKCLEHSKTLKQFVMEIVKNEIEK